MPQFLVDVKEYILCNGKALLPLDDHRATDGDKDESRIEDFRFGAWSVPWGMVLGESREVA